MLLENNTDLSKSPAVGISVPMRAALKKTRWLHLLLTRFLLKCHSVYSSVMYLHNRHKYLWAQHL